MKMIDAHCDVLCKMYSDDGIRFSDGDRLEVTYERLKENGALLQLFAIFLPDQQGQQRFEHILHSVDLFYRHIVSCPDMIHVTTAHDLVKAADSGKIGAMLTLEGADGLMGNELYVRTLFRLGVRAIGITWNYGNWAADGCMEPRQGGFSLKGKRFVKECNDLGILLDVSHLAEKGFWELTELSDKPFIASHSNARSIMEHPRNLKDDQIQAIIRRDGMIGITFVPYFVHASEPVKPTDLLRHIDHVCALGGERHIGFGSDFDGVGSWIEGLEHAGKYGTLADLLSKHYSADLVDAFLHKNWFSFFVKNLPQSI